MDYGGAEQNDVGYYGGGGDDRGEDDLQYEEENRQELYSRGGGDIEPPIRSLDGSSAGHELKHSIDESSPSAGLVLLL